MEYAINESRGTPKRDYRMEHDELNGWLSFFAGPIGAIAYATMQESVPPRRMLVMAFVGSFVSVFLAPWACLMFGLSEPRAQAGVGFVFGMLGMQVARTMISWAERSMPHVYGLFLSRLLGPDAKKLISDEVSLNHEKLAEKVEALEKVVNSKVE